MNWRSLVTRVLIVGPPFILGGLLVHMVQEFGPVMGSLGVLGIIAIAVADTVTEYRTKKKGDPDGGS